MLRTTKLAAAFAAITALGAGAAPADIITTQRVYAAPEPGIVYTAPATVYVAPGPTVITGVAPPAVQVPGTVVTEEYVEPGTYRQVIVGHSRTYVDRATGTRVIVRPANCGLYHYWDGAGCVDARADQTIEIRD
jgi:hypothetical protein